MEKLFDDTLLVKNERPRELTKQQKEKFIEDIAHQIIKYQYSSDDHDMIVEDLDDIDLFIGNSGFELAKELDSSGDCEYIFEGDFIDFLDNIQYEVHQAVNERVKLWVKAYNPQPKFEKGAKLIITGFLNVKLKKDVIIYITGFREEEAIYLVSEDKNNQGGILISYEKLEQNSVITA